MKRTSKLILILLLSFGNTKATEPKDTSYFQWVYSFMPAPKSWLKKVISPVVKEIKEKAENLTTKAESLVTGLIVSGALYKGFKGVPLLEVSAASNVAGAGFRVVANTGASGAIMMGGGYMAYKINSKLKNNQNFFFKSFNTKSGKSNKETNRIPRIIISVLATLAIGYVIFETAKKIYKVGSNNLCKIWQNGEKRRTINYKRRHSKDK